MGEVVQNLICAQCGRSISLTAEERALLLWEWRIKGSYLCDNCSTSFVACLEEYLKQAGIPPLTEEEFLEEEQKDRDWDDKS